MKITVDDLKPGMLVNITYRKKGEKVKELKGIVTHALHHQGEYGSGGMDQGSPTYTEYHISRIEYTSAHGLKLSIPSNIPATLVLDGKGTWAGNPYDILELTYVGMTKSSIFWEYDANLSDHYQEAFGSAFIERIKKKVKGVLTDEELNVLLSMGGN